MWVIVPLAGGIVRANGGSFVVGCATAGGMVILAGLERGELIATAGVWRRTPGQEVTLLGSPEQMPQ